MPGLVGIIAKREWDVRTILDEVTSRAANANSRLKIDRYDNILDNISLARIHLNIFNPGPQPCASHDGKTVVFFDGELYSNDSGKNDPSWVLEKYTGKGNAFIKDLDGVFACVICDLGAGEIKVFTDRFGLKPIYYHVAPGGSFSFSADIKDLLRLPFVPKTPDRDTMADLIAHSSAFGDSTIFKEIKLLPNASCASFNLRAMELKITPYWGIHALFADMPSSANKVNEDLVAEAFFFAVQKRIRGRENACLALSGGKDSRAILAALGKEAAGFNCLTTGIQGCMDEKVARILAKSANAKHHFIELDESYISDYLTNVREIISLSCGMYPSHEMTERAVMCFLSKHAFSLMLRGHGAELAKPNIAWPIYTDDNGAGKVTHPGIIRNISEKFDFLPQSASLQRIFTPSFYEHVRHSRERGVTDLLNKAAFLVSAEHVPVFFYLQEWLRRRTVAAEEIFRNSVEVGMPFLDFGFLTLLFALPLERRRKSEIQKLVIRKYMPGLLKVPDAHSGAALDAGPLSAFLHSKALALLQRANVYGFRHYSQPAIWCNERAHYQAAISSILLGERSSLRDLVDTRFLKTFLDEKFRRRSLTHRECALVSSLVYMELTNQILMD